MKIFLTGGSGFVGNAIINALLARHHSIHALVNHRPINKPNVQSFPGGLFDNAALDQAMTDCAAVIHLVGIIAEKPAKGITFDRIHVQGTRQVVDAAKRAGITRYVQMSALGAAADSPSAYQRTKFAAEEYVRGSGLDWTILQPSLIHGPGGEFSQMEADWARGKKIPWLFMPYFGPGLLGRGTPFKIQPVFVEDVACAFVEALEKPQTSGQTYPIGGTDQITWPQMHQPVARILTGHNRLTFPIPAWYAKAITHVVPPALLPFTRDQVLMSQQDNICDLSKFTQAFGWTPRSFEETLRIYLN
jgi:NADH dehydrogenase